MRKYISGYPTLTLATGILLLVMAIEVHLSIQRNYGVNSVLYFASMGMIIFFSFQLGVLLFWWQARQPIKSELSEEIKLFQEDDFDVVDVLFQPRGIAPWLEKNLSKIKESYSTFERVSQLLGFINYSVELPRQTKLAINLAHEIFPHSTINIFLLDEGFVKFSVGSKRVPPYPIQDISEKDPEVKRAFEAIQIQIDLEKLRSLRGQSFFLPIRNDFPARPMTVLPLILWNRILGIIVYQMEECRPLEKEETVIATLLNRHIAVFVENHYLYQDKLKQERLSHEVEIARQIQENTLPQGMAPIKGFQIHALCKPCNEISGDYFDFIQLPQNRLLVAIADVSGKGFPAALFLSKIQTLVRSMAEGFESPAKFLTFLSRQMAKEQLGSLFATMTLLILQEKKNSVVFSSAGHCRPLIIRAKNDFIEEKNFEIGIPLGLFEPVGEEYVDQIIELTPYDGIFLFTDGLPDMVNSNHQRYGMESLKKALEKSPDSPAETMISNILDDAFKFRGKCPLEDDVTLLYIKSETQTI